MCKPEVYQNLLIKLPETSAALNYLQSHYQSILQEESHTIDLLSIQIDKFKMNTRLVL